MTMRASGTARARFAELGHGHEQTDAVSKLIADLSRSQLAGVSEDTLYLTEELVRLQWTTSDRQRTALTLLALASIISVREGSTRLPLGGDRNGYLGRIIQSLRRDAKARWNVDRMLADIRDLTVDVTFGRLIGTLSEFRPLVTDGTYLYQHRILQRERELAALLGQRMRATSPATSESAVDAAVADVASMSQLKLSAEQILAIRTAALHTLTVITGGPGTGKTAIVLSILRTLERLGVPLQDIAVAGPTGKAVDRLARSISGLSPNASQIPAPRTLHRLLGYIGHTKRFRHGRQFPLPSPVVIVDEASMVDLTLMAQLMSSLRDETRLILVGDADQLPSVDAGAVLRDMIEVISQRAPAQSVALTHTYRVRGSDPGGAAILTAASAINRGNHKALLSASRQCAISEPLPLEGVAFIDTASNAQRLSQFLDTWCDTHVFGDKRFLELASKAFDYSHGRFSDEDQADINTLLSFHERSRILTVTRRYGVGSDTINQRLHNRLVARSGLQPPPEFYPGEPLIMLRNDYQRGLHNGDAGIVLRVSEGGASHRYRAVFRRGDELVVFPLDALRRHIELAFALTIHKSQGSEFGHVAVLLPTADVPILTREMLYTGVTRARKSVTIVAGRPLLEIAVGRKLERHSGLPASPALDAPS